MVMIGPLLSITRVHAHGLHVTTKDSSTCACPGNVVITKNNRLMRTKLCRWV